MSGFWGELAHGGCSKFHCTNLIIRHYMKKKLVSSSTLLLAAIPALLTKNAVAKPHSIKVETISSMRSPAYNNQALPPPGAALIVVHEPHSQRLLVVNQAAKRGGFFF